MLLLLACDGRSPEDTDPVGHDQDSGDVETIGDETAEETGDSGHEPDVPTPDVVVDCEGGGDFTTIGAAMAASESGTKIGLRPCTYEENVDFAGKSLDIFGIEGPAATVIDGRGGAAVVTAMRGESVGTRLAGVTVTGGGRGDGYASAVHADGSVLTLEDVVLTGNEGAYAVIYAQATFFELRDVTVRDNSVSRDGAIFIFDNGSGLIERLTLECEGESYGIYQHNSLMILDSRVECGTRVATYVTGGELHARRSTFRSDGYAVYAEDNNDSRTERLWMFNSAFVGGSVGVEAQFMHVKADHDVFWGDEVGLRVAGGHAESYVHNSVGVGGQCGVRGDGNLELGWDLVTASGDACRDAGYSMLEGDPLFVDAPNDFTLQSQSPLLDAGDPDVEQDDGDGSRSDLGVYGGPEGDGPR